MRQNNTLNEILSTRDLLQKISLLFTGSDNNRVFQ